MDIDSSYQLANGGIKNINYTVNKMVVMIFAKSTVDHLEFATTLCH